MMLLAKKSMRGLAAALLMLALGFGGLAVVGCGDNNDTAEDVGEAIDDAADDVKDAADDATDN